MQFIDIKRQKPPLTSLFVPPERQCSCYTVTVVGREGESSKT